MSGGGLATKGLTSGASTPSAMLDGSGLLTSSTPDAPLFGSEGVALADTPEKARWTPIALVVTVATGMSFVLVAQIGLGSALVMVVYADELEGLQNLFLKNSTVESVQTLSNAFVALSGHTGGDVTTVYESKLGNVIGNTYTLQFVADLLSGAPTLSETGTAITVHFCPNPTRATNVGEIEDLITASSALIRVKTVGNRAGLVAADDVFGALSLAGGAVTGRILTLSVLPNGGWIREQVVLVPYICVEATPTDAIATGALDADPETARWTSVDFTIAVPMDLSALVIAQIGDDPVLTLVAYSDELGGIQPLFEGKTVVDATGAIGDVDGRSLDMVILPNGGWTKPTITIVPYVGVEATE